jgi:hypothetical protein
MILVDYRRLFVRIMKEIVENDYSILEIEEDGDIIGCSNSGFILEDEIFICGSEENEQILRERNNIPNEIPYQKIPLGYINDIYIKYNHDAFDKNEMDKISDDLYEVLGNKFDLMDIYCEGV